MPTRQSRKTATSKEESTTTSGAGETQPEEQADPALTEEEWAKARAALLASLPDEKDRPKNIYARLAQILGFIHQIPKTGWNAFHKYKYAKESDIVEAVRPILSAYGIFPEVGLAHDPESQIVAVSRLSKTLKDRDRNIIGTSEDITQVMLKGRFVWWNPESKELETTADQLWAGYGDDAGDKGIYKAITGGVKYMLMKTFQISTGDDPEGDESTDKRAAAREADRPVTVQRGGQQGRRPPAAGGRQEGTSEPQRKVLKDLLVKAGLKDAKSIIEKIESLVPDLKIPVEGDDYAKAFATFMPTMPGPALGLVIRKLREELGEPEATVSPVREEPPVATDDTAELDAAAAEGLAAPASTEETAADGWANEDPEGSDAAPSDVPADAGVLEGDEAAAV